MKNKALYQESLRTLRGEYNNHVILHLFEQHYQATQAENSRAFEALRNQRKKPSQLAPQFIISNYRRRTT